MDPNSDGGPNPTPAEQKSKKRKLPDTRKGNAVDYKIFTKTNYTRQFSENHSVDCVIYVESQENEKIGNKNPIALTKLFTENVKGIAGVHRVNAYKVGITFRKPAPANNFLTMTHFLGKHKLKAFVPAHLIEITGVIRYVPKDLSNEDIYKSITCDAEVHLISNLHQEIYAKGRWKAHSAGDHSSELRCDSAATTRLHTDVQIPGPHIHPSITTVLQMPEV
ncbi:unnamed protein product [Parnassius apollo]|uniref:(apollo) hypothetical protein n=1 Tax=Parnassius apollo TaxID=110799 RepID=A0A8S3WPL4_PARAO|nr:unnamed protein product [Parnassius apollo]